MKKNIYGKLKQVKQYNYLTKLLSIIKNFKNNNNNKLLNHRNT